MNKSCVRPLGLLLLLAGCQKPPPPSPEPKEIVLTVEKDCREGVSIPISADAKDATGKKLDGVKIDLAAEPSLSGSVEGGNLRCAREGEIRVTATLGTLKAAATVTVTSPLVGFWVRLGDDKAGLRLRVEPGTDGLGGYVVEPPNADAIPFMKKQFPALSADGVLKCAQSVWAPGIKKWKSVKRSAEKRWSLSDLAKPVTLRHCNPLLGECTSQCTVGKTEYIEDYELTLLDPTHAEVRRTTAGSGDAQRWERVEVPVTDAGTVSDASSPPAALSGSAAPVPQASSSSTVAVAPTQRAGSKRTCVPCPDGYSATSNAALTYCSCANASGDDKTVQPPRAGCVPAGPCGIGCAFTCP